MTKAKKVILIGNGGHAKVLRDILKLQNTPVFAISALDSKDIGNYKFYSNESIVQEFSPEEIDLINGIGSLPFNNSRWKIDKFFREQGFNFLNVFHPSVILGEEINLSSGVQLMAGAIIQPGTFIGNGCIINTAATIDHDCYISDNCHIAPGVNISGSVFIGPNTHIGTGAKVIQGVKIGRDVVIAAGATVYKNIPDGSVYKGV